MELSSKLEYALLAMLEIANSYESGETLQIQQIAGAQDIPKRYLEQLLATLRRGNLIKSTRGVKGGYILAREPHQITLLDVLNCIEGLEATEPIANTNSTSPGVKVIAEIWEDARQALYSVLQQHSLQDLCDSYSKHSHLPLMYYI
jgi:Rrf2 family protein